MKKFTFMLCAMFLLGISYTQAQITADKTNNQGDPSSVDMEELIALSSNTTVRVPAGSTVLDYLQDGFGVELNPMLSGIGFTVTEGNGSGDLDVLLPSMAWDLVVLQAHNVPITANEVTAISNYLAGGGKLIMSYWALDTDPGLQTIVGVSNTISFTSPFPVFVWDGPNPIFNTPNVIPGLALIGDNGGTDNGDRLEPAAGAVALAGFVAAPTVNEAAIIEGNGGNSYFHGFSGLDLDLTSYLNLIENEAEFFALGVNDNTIQGFDYYPNPATNRLTLSALDNIERVAIYNILGQKVIDQSIDAITSEVNVSKLAVGTYILSVTVNGQTGRYKFIKR